MLDGENRVFRAPLTGPTVPLGGAQVGGEHPLAATLPTGGGGATGRGAPSRGYYSARAKRILRGIMYFYTT